MLSSSTMNTLHPQQTIHRLPPPEPTEPTELIKRLSRLRVALEAATRDNTHLQRELAAARAENRRMREQRTELAALKVRETRRRMLSEPWSRNP